MGSQNRVRCRDCKWNLRRIHDQKILSFWVHQRQRQNLVNELKNPKRKDQFQTGSRLRHHYKHVLLELYKVQVEVRLQAALLHSRSSTIPLQQDAKCLQLSIS